VAQRRDTDLNFYRMLLLVHKNLPSKFLPKF
jgi:hypothetical protein